MFAAVAAGVIGHLLKVSDGDDILNAVRSAASGQAVFGPSLATRLRAWFHRPPTPRSAADVFPELTTRERDILDGLAAGPSRGVLGTFGTGRRSVQRGRWTVFGACVLQEDELLGVWKTFGFLG